ncbi:MAG TPA: (d)CMP kinase [Candidatus Limnocylindrales bacterium]|nr:(d)CMP kinase [Candidatus Limnocylindrales bacterium]
MSRSTDGAASGKTTISQLLAAQTGHLYLDTGAMYRAVASKEVVAKMRAAVDAARA